MITPNTGFTVQHIAPLLLQLVTQRNQNNTSLESSAELDSARLSSSTSSPSDNTLLRLGSGLLSEFKTSRKVSEHFLFKMIQLHYIPISSMLQNEKSWQQFGDATGHQRKPILRCGKSLVESLRRAHLLQRDHPRHHSHFLHYLLLQQRRLHYQ